MRVDKIKKKLKRNKSKSISEIRKFLLISVAKKIQKTTTEMSTARTNHLEMKRSENLLIK